MTYSASRPRRPAPDQRVRDGDGVMAITADNVAAPPARAGVAVTAGSADGGTAPWAVEPASDNALLGRIAAGDQLALGEFYDRFATRVYSLARRICAAESAAEDVSQEVFLEVWRRAGRFDPGRGSAPTWLLTLTHHKAVDAVRLEATVRRHCLLASDDGWALPPGPGADHAAVGAIVADHVRDALAALAPAQRQVLALAYYGGHTQSEVASTLGVPLGTVKSRTFTALALLRDQLQPLHDLG